MVTLHKKKDMECNWEVQELTDLKGSEFPVAIRFSGDSVYIFPTMSEQNEIWQVAEDEFMILSGCELFHTKFTESTGMEILYRRPAKHTKTIFDDTFVCFDDFYNETHLYFVSERMEISDIIKGIISPSVSVTVEPSPLLVRIDAPYISARFPLRHPLNDTYSGFALPNGSRLCFGFYDCTVSWVKCFEDFVKVARERCHEAKIAEYYEKCGGYLIDGEMTRGIFSQKIYSDSVNYEFSPEDFFTRIAVPKLLAANGLVEVMPKKTCSFLNQGIENSEFSIGLSHDILIITEHTERGDRSYTLDMYGESCLGIRQIGDDSFVVLTSVHSNEPDADNIKLRYVVKYGPNGNFVWDNSAITTDGKCYIPGVRCQLNNDIILFEKEPNDHGGCHNFEMWSISKGQSVNFADTFSELYWSRNNWLVAHTEKQILVKPIGAEYKRRSPRIMLALRLYRPKEYCDVYALLDPQAKYRVFGKSYNMLADAMTDKPRVIGDLVKLLDQNAEAKAATSEHLSSTLK